MITAPSRAFNDRSEPIDERTSDEIEQDAANRIGEERAKKHTADVAMRIAAKEHLWEAANKKRLASQSSGV